MSKINPDIRLQIERYLANEMSKVENASFEKLLVDDLELSQEVDLSRQLNLFLVENNDIGEVSESEFVHKIRKFLRSSDAADLRKNLKNIHEEALQPKNNIWNRNRFKFVAIAATIVILFGLFFFNQPSGIQLYNEYYNETDLPKIIMRDDSANLVDRAVLSFQEENYESTIRQLNQYFETTENPDSILYIYRGLSHSQLGQDENAMQDFDLLIKSNHLDRSKGLWFKALTYLKSDDSSKAKVILHQITEDPSSFKYTEALELYQKLN